MNQRSVELVITEIKSIVYFSFLRNDYFLKNKTNPKC